ncbi:MAG: AMP-binding protein, partial [Actinobacteria bacterium]|nr:AMP-binding protein [Actinomycetota bacterium]
MRRRLEAPDGFVPFPREALGRSIADRFASVAALNAHACAVSAPDRSLTYAELREESEALAAAIAAEGPAAPAAVVLVEQRAALAVALLAVLEAGRAYVPLDPLFPERRLTRTIERSGADVVLATAETRELARRVAGRGIRVVDVERPPEPAATARRRPLPDDLAYVYYTSGSTGEPKGVMDTHRNVLHNVLRYTNTLHLGPGDRLTLLQRPAFSGAVSSFFGAVLNGGTSCLFDLAAQGAPALGRWLAEERITVYHSVPSIFHEIAPAAETYEAMRVVRLEGDRATPADLELFARHFDGRCTLVNGLGATECGLVRQFFFGAGDSIPPVVPIGYPVEDMEVTVEGAEPGAAGEIIVRSPYLATGYWRDPERTAERFVELEGGLRAYRTGDTGRLER